MTTRLDDGYTVDFPESHVKHIRPLTAEQSREVISRLAQAKTDIQRERIVRNAIADLTRHLWTRMSFGACLEILKRRLVTRHEEQRDLQNLIDGVWLELQHPYVASRSCEHCKLYMYDHRAGTVLKKKNRPVQRPPGTPLPCESAEGCAKGTPENPKCLSEKNKKAYQHYLRCKATCSFPDDDIVAQHATVIRKVEEESFKADLIKALK